MRNKETRHFPGSVEGMERQASKTKHEQLTRRGFVRGSANERSYREELLGERCVSQVVDVRRMMCER